MKGKKGVLPKRLVGAHSSWAPAQEAEAASLHRRRSGDGRLDFGRVAEILCRGLWCNLDAADERSLAKAARIIGIDPLIDRCGGHHR